MEINTEKDLKEIKDIKIRIYNIIQFCGDPQRFIKQAQEIANRNEFKNWCGKWFSLTPEENNDKWICGKYGQLCPNCQSKKEIQEIWESIKNGR